MADRRTLRSTRSRDVARVLGIDYGERRVGLALGDPSGTIATPLPTLNRRRGKRPPVAAVTELVNLHGVRDVVLGLPLDLAGEETDWTREVRAFGDAVARRADVLVHYIDERMTSVRAERAVRSLGLPRAQRERKERVDAAAAVLILQAWLDAARRNAGPESA